MREKESEKERERAKEKGKSYENETQNGYFETRRIDDKKSTAASLGSDREKTLPFSRRVSLFSSPPLDRNFAKKESQSSARSIGLSKISTTGFIDEAPTRHRVSDHRKASTVRNKDEDEDERDGREDARRAPVEEERLERRGNEVTWVSVSRKDDNARSRVD